MMNWKELFGLDELFNRDPVSGYLPYREYDPDYKLFHLVFPGGDDAIGASWMVRPLLGLSEETMRTFEGVFRLGLPQGTTVQFSFFANDMIDYVLDKMVELRRQVAPDTPYVMLVEEIRKFYLEAQKSHLIPSSGVRPRNFQVFISVSFPLSRNLTTSEQYEEEIETVSKDISKVESALTGMSGGVERLDDLGMLTVLYFILNPSHTWEGRPQHVDENAPLHKQMVRYDSIFEQRRDYFELDGMFGKSLTVQEFPNPEEARWHGSKNRELMGSLRLVMDQITCRFLVTLNVVYLDVLKERNRLSQKHFMLTNQYSPTLARMIPTLGAKKFNFDLAAQQFEDGSVPIGAYYHIVVFDQTLEGVNRHAQRVIQHYMKFSWTVAPDPAIGFLLFLHSLPMALPPDVKYLRDNLMRLKTLNSRVVSHLLPIVGDWQGFGRPICVLTSRSGQLLTFDPFSNPSGNYSMCIAGNSGSGKSFFMNYLMVSYLGVGARIWAIDKGGSYTKLCQQVGGQTISFNEVKDRIGLNPFGLMVNQDLEDRQMVISVLAKMAAPTEMLSDLEMRALEQAFDHVWEAEGRKGTPASIGRVLKESADQRVRDLATRLHPFSEGKYKDIFKRTALVEFNNQFVLLEVSGLEAIADFRSVLLMQLVMNINREMWTNQEILAIPKIVVIDEAHELLSESNGFVGKFVVNAARTIRKRKGGVAIITQGLEDYYNKFPPYGAELLQNSDFIALLQHKGESLEMLKRRGEIVLSQREMAMLASVHRNGREYSEVFLRVPGGVGIGRLVMDPLSRWVFTTDPNELAQIQKYVDQGLSVVEACLECVKAEGREENARGKGTGRRKKAEVPNEVPNEVPV